MFRNFAFKCDFGGFFYVNHKYFCGLSMCCLANAIEIASIVFKRTYSKCANIWFGSSVRLIKQKPLVIECEEKEKKPGTKNRSYILYTIHTYNKIIPSNQCLNSYCTHLHTWTANSTASVHCTHGIARIFWAYSYSILFFLSPFFIGYFVRVILCGFFFLHWCCYFLFVFCCARVSMFVCAHFIY